ncbi:MAG TPA: hypothetical protein VMT00_13750 [Thermoanaerobaculia bacterium]|nr:hypothetical protein [Thermoanaerobaculia bacterium]
MQIASGKVVNGKVVIDGDLPEGAEVTLLALDGEETGAQGMVAWVSTPRGRRQTAAIGASIAVLGALAILGGVFFGRLPTWFGIAVLLLAMAIIVWAFAHKTVSGLPPLSRNVDARWRKVAEHSRGALIDVRFAGTYTSDGLCSREMKLFRSHDEALAHLQSALSA